MSITSKGKKACVIMDGDKVVTKILVLQEVWELEGDMLLKFAVDVKKGTTLFMIDDSTEVTANDDYKAGDYLYFSKGTFKPTRVRFLTSKDNRYDWYSEVRFLKGFDISKITNLSKMFGGYSFGANTVIKLIDVTSFDTSQVTDMSSMFSNCTSLTNLLFGAKWGTQTSTAANALTLDLSTIGSSKSYKLTDETYNSMLTMYDRASNGLTTMTIKFNTKHNLPDGFAEKMSALGYTITLV